VTVRERFSAIAHDVRNVAHTHNSGTEGAMFELIFASRGAAGTTKCAAKVEVPSARSRGAAASAALLTMLLSMAATLSSWLGWPLWTLYTLVALVCSVMLLSLVSRAVGISAAAAAEKADPGYAAAKTPSGFVAFQRKYLAVYLVVMLADWMQGTNMWTLYNSYEVDIGTLFLTGFICSAVFSLFAGSLVDKFGRKRGCLLYCALEVVINVLEHYPTFEVLWVGRVMGGFSTCLLFSVFESWYVSAHRARKYPEELIEQTFSKATQGNGLAAVAAGLLAQVAADAAGEIGPFQAAIALTVVAGVLVALFFDENYGSAQAQERSLSQSFGSGLQTLKSPPVMLVAMGGTFYEGATYTFVFMWVPVMIGLVGASTAAAAARRRPPPAVATRFSRFFEFCYLAHCQPRAIANRSTHLTQHTF
jgi:MFS family permease